MTSTEAVGVLVKDKKRKASPPVEFYIPATTSILERRPRTLKHDDAFAVLDHYGDIVWGDRSPEGLFYKDTRYLSDLRILLNGRRPLLLSSTVQDNNALLTADLTNPDIVVDGRLVLARDMIHVIRSKFLWEGACYERLGVRNFDSVAQVIEFNIQFAADFADIFEVRGHKRAARGETEVRFGREGATFIYRGLDQVERRTVLRFDPAPEEIDEFGATISLRLEPGESKPLFFTVACEDGLDPPCPPRGFFECLRESRRALRAASARATGVKSSNEIFNEVLDRSMSDLSMLVTNTAEGPFPYAGIPWFSTPFGRDAIITAIETLWMDPSIAKGVLKYLAATQATDLRPESDAEPGKILHETRSGEMARLGEVPFRFYYGSVDSTPLFVMLAGLYFDRTGDLQTVSDLWPNIEAALAWIDDYGDRDGDGFVEYHRMGEAGLVNQGWKDSVDSVFHADGRFAQGSIALCEVQGYVYAAKREAAKLAAAIGFTASAESLRMEAEQLRVRFEDAFWCEDIGTYAIALDGAKEPCRVRSSNAGQLLFTGIVSEARAKRVADQLMGPSFFTGWGVRTIASSEARYNPMSYHDGSVWPHDNALIGLGFARYGLKHQVQQLFSGLFDTAAYMDLRRLPELFCGFRRTPGKAPTLYPVACSPQAWSCAAPFSLLEACLGLELQFAEDTVRFRKPKLPTFLNEVILRDLKLGHSRFDILLRRYGSDVSVNVLKREGEGRIEVTL